MLGVAGVNRAYYRVLAWSASNWRYGDAPALLWPCLSVQLAFGKLVVGECLAFVPRGGELLGGCVVVGVHVLVGGLLSVVQRKPVGVALAVALGEFTERFLETGV